MDSATSTNINFYRKRYINRYVPIEIDICRDVDNEFDLDCVDSDDSGVDSDISIFRDHPEALALQEDGAKRSPAAKRRKLLNKDGKNNINDENGKDSDTTVVAVAEKRGRGRPPKSAATAPSSSSSSSSAGASGRNSSKDKDKDKEKKEKDKKKDNNSNDGGSWFSRGVSLFHVLYNRKTCRI